MSESRRLTESEALSHTYEITQKPGKLPDPRRSSSTGMSGSDGNDEDVVVAVVVVDSMEKNSEDVDES
jgi:hypothetical protein